MMGKKLLNFCKQVVFVDKKNSLIAEIYFNFEELEKLKHQTKNLTKEWFANLDKKPTDFFATVIYKYAKLDNGEVKKEAIASGWYLSLNDPRTLT